MTRTLLEREIAAPASGWQPDPRAAGSWLLDMGIAGPQPPMLIFPHIGGGPAAYRQLALHWNHRMHPFVVHLPGRESRIDEEPVRAMPSLIRALVPAVLPVIGARFVFYGHSMGALIAFELARHIRRSLGIEPEHLIVSGYPAPPTLQHRGRHLLADVQLWEAVRATGGLHPAVATDPQMRTLLLPVLRADFAICETYSYMPDIPLTCPISAFAGAQDDEVDIADVAGWADETSSCFRYELLPGGHFFNIGQPGEFADRVLRHLTLTLDVTGPWR